MTEIKNLKPGDKFYFSETPKAVKTIVSQFNESTLYAKSCGWKVRENNINRLVNKI